MTAEEFRNIAQGVQAIFVSVAALGGGIWALMKFGITGEKTRASLELEKLESEIKKLTGISSEMRISHKSSEDGAYYVYVDVVMTNHSPRIKVLKTDDFPFRVNRAYFLNGEWAFEEQARLMIANAPSASDQTAWEWPTSVKLLPETPVSVSLFYETRVPGNYMFSFICGDQEPTAKSTEDRQALQRSKEIYESYRDHPYYVAEVTPKYEIHRHYYVGPATSAPATG